MSPDILSLIIGGIAIAGGLAVGAIIVYTAIMQDTKSKMALLEAKTKERLALIEKGMDPELVNKAKPKDYSGALLWGFLLSGLGLGASMGLVITHLTGYDHHILVYMLMLLFGGAGLILFYYIKKKNDLNKSM